MWPAKFGFELSICHPWYRLRTVNEFYPTTHLCHHQWVDVFIKPGIQEDSKALYRFKRIGNQLVMSVDVTVLHAPTSPPVLSFESA